MLSIRIDRVNPRLSGLDYGSNPWIKRSGLARGAIRVYGCISLKTQHLRVFI